MIPQLLTNIANPIANPGVTTTYYVEVTTPPYGCIAIDSVVITVVVEPIIKFPTAFSPNGDGNNDHYHPIVIGPLNNYLFRIYNRWGQMVYSSSNQDDEGWDGTFKGKMQDIGVYDYYFEGISSETGTHYKNKGNITLLRYCWGRNFL
jgi:gliding motility-associated-like protein